jgi:hypothetical protein
MLSTQLVDEFRSQFSSFFANLAAAFFIWLVAILVFIPLSWTVTSPISLSLLVSLAFLGAVLFFGFRSVLNGKKAIDRYDDLRRVRLSAQGPQRSQFKSLGYLSLLAIVAILVVPLLWTINAALGGIGLVGILFVATIVAFPLVEIMIDRAVAMNNVS